MYDIGNLITSILVIMNPVITKTTNEEVVAIIKSNLPILMAKNGIRTIEELRVRTGISRATLTSIYYGKGKGVQFQTLGTLCKVLDAGVGDILEYENKEETA